MEVLALILMIIFFVILPTRTLRALFSPAGIRRNNVYKINLQSPMFVLDLSKQTGQRNTNTHTIHIQGQVLSANPPSKPPQSDQIMGKGGMKRDNHHCPQSRRGGCRWVHEPVHRCYTHTYVCPIHNTPHQTFQSCLSCEHARQAAERALRNQVSRNRPNNRQNNQGKKK